MDEKTNNKKYEVIKSIMDQMNEKVIEQEKTIDACSEIMNNPKLHDNNKIQEAIKDYYLAKGNLQGIEFMTDILKEFEEKLIEHYLELDSEKTIKVENKPELKLSRTDFRLLILSAFRYALGRMTYIVPVVANVIRESKDKLDSQAIDLIIQEIEDAEKRDGLGMECDIDVWLRLKKELEDFRSSKN